MSSIQQALDNELIGRLQEIDDQLKDWHISAYKCDLLYKEMEAIKAELHNRGITKDRHN